MQTLVLEKLTEFKSEKPINSYCQGVPTGHTLKPVTRKVALPNGPTKATTVI